MGFLDFSRLIGTVFTCVHFISAGRGGDAYEEGVPSQGLTMEASSNADFP